MMCVISENKREMFDGMRAYHQSEISHANHAITMLLAIAAATGTVVFAILFPQATPHHVYAIAWGLFIVVSLFSFTIAYTAQIKINGDHEVYASFGKEYVKSSILLGLYDKEVTMDDGTIEKLKTNKKIGQGSGYRKTQKIIWAFAGLLTSLTMFFACFIREIVAT